jgi:hypothetical protein
MFNGAGEIPGLYRLLQLGSLEVEEKPVPVLRTA